MRISCWSETYQSYSVVFQNIWQSYINRKRVKAIQFYSKTYDNLTLIGNLSKLFSSIPKHIIILHLLETSQSDTVLFQQMWESYINWERIKATLVHSKAYDSLRMIGKLMKAIQFYFKTYNNLTLSRNLAKLFSPIPKDMTNLCLTETYQSYSVLFQNIRQSYVDQETYQSYTVPFQNIWQSYIDQKLIKTIQFYSKVYENLMFIQNSSKLFSSISKHMKIVRWSDTYQSYSVLFQNMRILCWLETYQSYSVLVKNIWQSDIDRKLMKANQFYSKTYNNLLLIRNLWKLFSSIPKHMTILHWSRKLSKLYSSI